MQLEDLSPDMQNLILYTWRIDSENGLDPTPIEVLIERYEKYEEEEESPVTTDLSYQEFLEIGQQWTFESENGLNLTPLDDILKFKKSKRRGNAEALINWYENGGGAERIAWGEEGDWTRCYGIASKYLPDEDARGFCANRHHAATGYWPGQKNKDTGDYKTGIDKADKLSYVEYLREKVEEFYNKNHDKQGRFSEEAGVGVGESVIDKAREPGGGATLQPSTGEDVIEGYAVAVSNEFSSITPVAEFFSGPPGEEKGREILKAWLKQNKELFSDPKIKIGLWHDEEHSEIVLDASEQFMDRDRALVAGRFRNQQGIYHLVPGGEGYIPTGGTGGREEALSSSGSGLTEPNGRRDRPISRQALRSSEGESSNRNYVEYLRRKENDGV